MAFSEEVAMPCSSGFYAASLSSYLVVRLTR